MLKALRQGRLTLKQVRLFARLPDKKQQAEIAQTALDGYFQDYQLRHMVEGDRATVDDDRFTLVGMDRYVAAGGRVSSRPVRRIARLPARSRRSCRPPGASASSRSPIT